jgi:hypothetical protein
MEIALNELSCEPIPPHKATAQEHMSRFVAVIRALARYGVKRSLRTLRTFLDQQLAPGYVVAQWLNDKSVEAEERIFIKTIATKAPYLSDILDSIAEQQNRVFSFSYEGSDAVGLGVAYLLDCPAASLGCNEKCLRDPVTIRMGSLDDSGDIVEQVVDVCCVSSVEQVAARGGWLRQRIDRENEVTDGEELWQKRGSAWPNLVFAGAVQAQVAELTGGEQFFSQLVRHLDVLNDAVGDWHGGKFILNGVVWSYESESTMKRPELVELRKFEFPDGQHRTCEAHTKLLGANYRIHFAVDQGERQAYIGYIGKHLRTAGM